MVSCNVCAEKSKVRGLDANNFVKNTILQEIANKTASGKYSGSLCAKCRKNKDGKLL